MAKKRRFRIGGLTAEQMRAAIDAIPDATIEKEVPKEGYRFADAHPEFTVALNEDRVVQMMVEHGVLIGSCSTSGGGGVG